MNLIQIIVAVFAALLIGAIIFIFGFVAGVISQERLADAPELRDNYCDDHKC